MMMTMMMMVMTMTMMVMTMMIVSIKLQVLFFAHCLVRLYISTKSH